MADADTCKRVSGVGANPLSVRLLLLMVRRWRCYCCEMPAVRGGGAHRAKAPKWRRESGRAVAGVLVLRLQVRGT